MSGTQTNRQGPTPPNEWDRRNPASPAEAANEIHERFRRLRRRLKMGVLSVISVPFGILFSALYLLFIHAIKERGNLHLASLAENQRNTIDLYLQERVTNVFGLFRRPEFRGTAADLNMEKCLQDLKQASAAFVDVGLFDSQGVQTEYAGPFPSLKGRDYSREAWHKALLTGEKDYYISDIYLGFRNQLHFTIAAREWIDGTPRVARATLDPHQFRLFLGAPGREEGVETALINREGFYQIVDPGRAELFSKSPFIPRREEEIRIEAVSEGGDTIVVAYARLRTTGWVLVALQSFPAAYGKLVKARWGLSALTALIVLAIAAVIWRAVDRLTGQAEATATARLELRSQLLHAAKLASVGELAAGVAHEINNPLAVIGANSGVIRDMLDPQVDLPFSPEAVHKELDTIDAMVFRARGIIQRLMDFSRRTPARLTPCNLNEILDEVVGGLKEREFLLSSIRLERDYDPALPLIPLDRDQISQVFLNLINNAGDAIDRAGAVTLRTRWDGELIRVSIADTGVGMSAEQLARAFLPFYTTKPPGKGTGLGLSISLSIVESMGGELQAESTPGTGSVFTVSLAMPPPPALDRPEPKGRP